MPCILLVDDRTAFQGKLLSRYAQSLRRHLQEHAPGLGRRLSHGDAEEPGAERTEGTIVERTEIGVAHHHVDRLQFHLELLGEHLGKRGDDALAHFDFPREQLDPAVCLDAQEGIEIVG